MWNTPCTIIFCVAFRVHCHATRHRVPAQMYAQMSQFFLFLLFLLLLLLVLLSSSSVLQTKKKRKRCGECIGCQKKDNCGDCAPCRNDKSHQICKQRRCEKLTDKKVRVFALILHFLHFPLCSRARAHSPHQTSSIPRPFPLSRIILLFNIFIFGASAVCAGLFRGHALCSGVRCVNLIAFVSLLFRSHSIRSLIGFCLLVLSFSLSQSYSESKYNSLGYTIASVDYVFSVSSVCVCASFMHKSTTNAFCTDFFTNCVCCVRFFLYPGECSPIACYVYVRMNCVSVLFRGLSSAKGARCHSS